MGAQEQHDGTAVAVVAFDPGEGTQALAGEALGEQRQVVRDAGDGGELVVAAVQEPLDCLSAVGTVELGGQSGRGGV